MILKLCGSIEDETGVPLALLGAEEVMEASVFERLMPMPPTSTMLRNAMIVNISQSVNRSTMSAQVSWKRFSFSNFLKTVPLISTN